jgi:hypothetical protein
MKDNVPHSEAARSTLGIFACVFLMSAFSVAQVAATPEVKPALASLAYFVGDWDCSGKFDSSGKVIEAVQHFAPELGGTWMVFRHDDKPPFNYHAVSEWGWDATKKEFLMTVQDSGGGARLFHSNGWNSVQLQWDGDAIDSASAPAQRFSFECLDDRHFKVSYFTRKADGWSRMDASTCTKK